MIEVTVAVHDAVDGTVAERAEILDEFAGFAVVATRVDDQQTVGTPHDSDVQIEAAVAAAEAVVADLVPYRTHRAVFHIVSAGMPEMLEVEAARRVLEECALGAEIAKVHAPDTWFMKGGTTAPTLRHTLVGNTFTGARRIGKQIILDTRSRRAARAPSRHVGARPRRRHGGR